jgi:hypothetical protein
VLDAIPGNLKPKKTARIVERLLELPATEGDESIVYQHSVLCQTCLPYRDPGDTVRTWERANGRVNLVVAAGQAFHPQLERFIDVGLPFGPKPRLVLYHLNAEALRTQSPQIELEDSLTKFVKRTLGLDTHGRNIRTVKEQLGRLAAADFRFGTMIGEGQAVTVKSSIIESFDLWLAKDAQQRVLWPSTVQFSPRYFESLMKHAVPLNEVAVTHLSHNAMALDIYTWLAQRLHRIETGQGALVPWASLWQQFGQGYAQVRQFRFVFTRTLRQVQVVYPEAKFEVAKEGMRLRHSRPPVTKRLLNLTPRDTPRE